ncbi:MAG: aminoglycoside phosphotransferase family protein [Patescibacteria group bacterium]|nr:aminoglycoside phosphotransferase family protein [Patescibacteria group bacterium]
MDTSSSTHKTRVSLDEAESFLASHYGKPVSDLSAISGGEGSQAFSFAIDGEHLILRVNKHGDRAFKKDLYAYVHFKSAALPIPEIKEIGTLPDGNHFAISQKIEGSLFKDLSDQEFDESLPSLLGTLDSVHKTDISESEGYGDWDADGKAKHKTWKGVLLDVDEFAESLFENSILEKDFWNEAYGKYAELVPACPEVRYLVHSDYNFDNVLAKDGKVTGVIDWANSMYGDFLYDVSWMQFFTKDFDYEQAYLDFHNLKEEDIPDFRKRVLCYQAYIGLGSLSFYAYSNQQDKYERSKKKLSELLGIG